MSPEIWSSQAGTRVQRGESRLKCQDFLLLSTGRVAGSAAAAAPRCITPGFPAIVTPTTTPADMALATAEVVSEAAPAAELQGENSEQVRKAALRSRRARPWDGRCTGPGGYAQGYARHGQGHRRHDHRRSGRDLRVHRRRDWHQRL